MNARAAVAVVVGLALLLSACTRTVDVADAEVYDGWNGCVDTGAFAERHAENEEPWGTLPNGFEPTRAVRCEVEHRSDADGNEVAVGVEKTATELDALLTYFDQPTTSGRSGQPCLGYLWIRPWLFLVDDDNRYVVPAYPLNGCGHPRNGEPTLTTTDEVVARIEVTTSARAVEVGCTERTELSLDRELARHSVKPKAIRSDPLHGRPATVCRYRATDDVPTDVRVVQGRFGSGARLSARRSRPVAALLSDLPAARPCGRQATRFAVVTPRGRGTSVFVYVELDGCHRVWVEEDKAAARTVAQGSPALLRALESV